MANVNQRLAPFPVLILKTGGYVVHHGGLGIVRSLGTLGVPVYAVIEDRFAPAAVSTYLKGTFVWNTRDLSRSQTLEGLQRIGRQLKLPTILIPTDDAGSILIAEEAATLRQWFLFPKLRSDIPRILADKSRLYALCKQLGVPCPQTILPTTISEVHEFIENATFPVVVKPARAWLKPKTKTSIVLSPQELLDVCHRSEGQVPSNLLIQEYIRDGEDWFFHGYCNAASECLAGFTGRKLRSYPPHFGFTTLGRSVTNPALLRQTEALIKAIPYAGIMDLDYRFDRRDGQYKLLDFNPRIGAQFRLFEDGERIDVARALYRDLTGQSVPRSQQTDGRVFVVEPHDCLTSMHHLFRRELSIRDWWGSFKGPKEFAWFKWNDPAPFLMVWIRLAISVLAKALNVLTMRSRQAF
jgi:D-aspartate ligase